MFSYPYKIVVVLFDLTSYNSNSLLDYLFRLASTLTE